MNKIILTVIGKDRPGIIASVSEVLYRLNCNIENISQTILQSEFAGIYIVSMPGVFVAEALEKEFAASLNDENLYVHVKLLEKTETGSEDKKGEPFIITTIGPDQKGLVYDISRVIADSGVNIANLKAVFEGGANPERNIMLYEVTVPAGTDVKAFSASLREKASELKLEVTIQHKNIFDTVNRI